MAPNASSSDLGERKTGEHNITFAEYKHGLVDTRFSKRSSTMSLISIGLCSRDKNVSTPVPHTCTCSELNLCQALLYAGNGFAASCN